MSIQEVGTNIELTEKAQRQVFQIQNNEGRVGSLLRLSVVGGGCSGLSYKLSFEDQPKDSDKLLNYGELKVVVDAKSMLFLKGMILDFSDGLNGQGFVFQNPNAKQTCGCGTSFSA